jgi:hypothetical protein
MVPPNLDVGDERVFAVRVETPADAVNPADGRQAAPLSQGRLDALERT